ncbi:MAG TPA: hypothetical protein VIY72_09345 [Acidimicrobiales bacterium]
MKTGLANIQSPDEIDSDALWEALRELVSYRYVGSHSVLVDRERAEGRMRIRHDMRTPVAPLTAPLAISALDAAGNSMDRFYKIAITHVVVDVFDPAPDVDLIVLHSDVVREARTQLFTDARIVAADDPQRVIGNVTLDWAVLAPTPPGFRYLDPGDGVPDTPDLPPLWEAYSARRRPGGGFVIDDINPQIGTKMSIEPVLHHGPILVVTEAAALEAAAVTAGTEDLVVEQASTRLVAAGRKGPFIITADALQTRDAVTCRSVLRDEGAGRDVAVAHLRMRAV